MDVNSGNNSYGIKFKDKIGYALGDTAGILTFSVVGSFLQMYYTDVLYINPQKILILFVIARLWDAVNDPLWGSFIDLSKPGKKGKFLPYIKWGSVPLAITGALLFFRFPGLSENQYLVYAYFTYFLYGMMYTLVNIPYGSLASVITTDEMERSSLSVYRSVGAALGGLPGQIILPLFVYSTVATTNEKVLDGSKLFIGVAALSAVSVIVYQLCYGMSVERVAPAKNIHRNSIGTTIKALLKNRPFIALCVASMLLLATQQYTQSIYNYLFKNYFEKPSLYALVTLFTYLPMVILLPFMHNLIKKIGKKEICAIGMLLAFISNFTLLLIKTDSPTVFFIFSFISGFGMMFFILEIWAMVIDVIDYQESLSGQRDDGTSYAFFTFTRKLGQAIAGVLGAGALELIGYDAKNITESAVSKMYDISTVVPAITCLLMAISLGFFYNLSKAKLKDMYNKDA